jgi:hypothetical protein
LKNILLSLGVRAAPLATRGRAKNAKEFQCLLAISNIFQQHLVALTAGISRY